MQRSNRRSCHLFNWLKHVLGLCLSIHPIPALPDASLKLFFSAQGTYVALALCPFPEQFGPPVRCLPRPVQQQWAVARPAKGGRQRSAAFGGPSKTIQLLLLMVTEALSALAGYSDDRDWPGPRPRPLAGQPGPDSDHGRTHFKPNSSYCPRLARTSSVITVTAARRRGSGHSPGR